jgi:hypothetical protein
MLIRPIIFSYLEIKIKEAVTIQNNYISFVSMKNFRIILTVFIHSIRFCNLLNMAPYVSFRTR